MATYKDFETFIKNGISNDLIGSQAVRHYFEEFLKLAQYNDERSFFKSIVYINDLHNILKEIHDRVKAQGFIDFLKTDNGFVRSWLKYFILWYVCKQSQNYPPDFSMPDVKKNWGRETSDLDKFIRDLKGMVPKDYLESEHGISDRDSMEQNHSSNKNNIWLDWPRHIILWGAPGTSKSYTIDKKIDSIDEKIHSIDKLDQDNIIRVTFHPAMDYSSFVGAYKPVMDGKTIAYKFQPQAFLNAYEKACTDSTKPVFLIIEEINRGNCAQIFGDTFQLLDRDDNLESKYPITPNEDIKKWLESTKLEDKDRLKLPSNMFIWATMNSSDQSLYKLDSAFLRRWKMLYSPINPGDNDINIRIDKNTTVKWKDFLENINEKIAKECEDRRIGPFFVKGNSDGEISAVDFVGKVLNYLYRAVFNIYNIDCNPRDKDLSYDSFYNVGVPIFENNIINTAKLKEFFNLIGCNILDESSKTSKNDDIVDNSDIESEGTNHNEEETATRSEINVG